VDRNIIRMAGVGIIQSVDTKIIRMAGVGVIQRVYVLQPEILGLGVDGCLGVCSFEVRFCSPPLWQFGACWAHRSNGNVCPE
jgi:hypothetical protein